MKKKANSKNLNYLFKAKPDFPQLHGTFFSLFIILMYYINIITDAFYDVKNSTVYNTFLKFLLLYIGKNSFYLLYLVHFQFIRSTLGPFRYIVTRGSAIQSWDVRGSVFRDSVVNHTNVGNPHSSIESVEGGGWI